MLLNKGGTRGPSAGLLPSAFSVYSSAMAPAPDEESGKTTAGTRESA
jgi:hypothetical protein